MLPGNNLPASAARKQAAPRRGAACSHAVCRLCPPAVLGMPAAALFRIFRQQPPSIQGILPLRSQITARSTPFGAAVYNIREANTNKNGGRQCQYTIKTDLTVTLQYGRFMRLSLSDSALLSHWLDWPHRPDWPDRLDWPDRPNWSYRSYRPDGYRHHRRHGCNGRHWRHGRNGAYGPNRPDRL